MEFLPNITDTGDDSGKGMMGMVVGIMMISVMSTMMQGISGTQPGTGPGPGPGSGIATVQGSIYDSNENLLDGVHVELQGLTSSVFDKHYQFLEVPLGNYRIVVSKEGYLTKEENVSLSISDSITTQDFVLIAEGGIADRANLSGFVKSSSYPFNPIGGAIVLLNGASRTTAANGSYSFKDLEYGDYQISASAAGYYSSGNIDITLDKEDETRDIYLNPESQPVPIFEATGLDVSPTSIDLGGQVNIDVTVKNTGNAAGSCTVGTTAESDILLTISPSTYTPAVYVAPTVFDTVMQPIITLMLMVMMFKIIGKIAGSK